jgi:hypothetical protein
MKLGVGLVLVAWLLAGCSGDDTDGASATSGSTADAASDATTPVSAGDAGNSGACAEAGVPPSTLACAGLYANFETKEIAPNAIPYAPATPFWSDGAQKSRWIELPPNTQIDRTDPNSWQFPVGTKLFKEFRIDGQRVETRLFQKTTPNFWVFATYAWAPDATSATISYGGPVPAGNDGGTWTIPTNDQCSQCHNGRPDRVLGFEEVSLGLPLAQGLTLASLAEQGLLTPAPTTTSLQIGDDGTGLDGLAMGWLHVNCGVTCHNSNPSAEAYGAGMILRLDPTQLDGTPPNAATWENLKTTINVPCVSGSVAGQPRIEPGNPTGSVIHEFISQRGSDVIQMPPIATVLVDTPDVTVIADWVQALGSASSDQDGGTDDAGEPQDAGEPSRDGGHHVDGGKVEDSGADDASVDAAVDASENDDGGESDAGAADASAG